MQLPTSQTLTLVLVLLLTPSVKAETTAEDLDLILEQFDESIQTTLPPTTELEATPWSSRFVFSGVFSELFSYSPYPHKTPAGFKLHGLRNLQSTFQLTADAVITDSIKVKVSGWLSFDAVYTLSDYDSRFSSELIDEHEKELELAETFISVELSSDLDFSFGRQILVWGKADMFRVNDLWNPADSREPNLASGKSAKLPLFMSRLDYSANDWNITAAVTHEYWHEKTPVYGSEFYPYNFIPPPFEDQKDRWEQSSYGVSASRSFTGIDLGLYTGSYVKDYNQIGMSSDTVTRKMARIQTIGAAAEMAAGNWLFKVDSSFLHGLEYYLVDDEGEDRFDLLIGVDYSGFTNSRISFEAVNRYLFDYSDATASQENTPPKDLLIWALRYSRYWLGETLQLEGIAYTGGIDFSKGSAQKVSLKYQLLDDLLVSGGVIFYQSGDTYLTDFIGKNDLVFLQFKYTF